jgi:hypothetical protein
MKSTWRLLEQLTDDYVRTATDLGGDAATQHTAAIAACWNLRHGGLVIVDAALVLMMVRALSPPAVRAWPPERRAALDATTPRAQARARSPRPPREQGSAGRVAGEHAKVRRIGRVPRDGNGNEAA